MAITITKMGRNVVLDHSTGTEAAPVVEADGVLIDGVVGAIHAETAGVFTAGGKLDVYLWNPCSARFVPCPDLVKTLLAVSSQAFTGFPTILPGTRMLLVPNGAGVAT